MKKDGGGVFDADNWNIEFLTNIGNDNGETVMYGKNLQGIEVYEDWSNVVTKLYPVGCDELMLPEVFLESDIQYTEPYTRTVDFNTDLESEEQTQINLIKELREKASAYLEENKVPKISYTVSVNVNEALEMGDTVHIKHPLCNILAEVVEYEYNVISEKTKRITVGNYTRDVKTKFNAIKENINKVAERVTTQERVIEAQTNLINSMNKNGLVYIDENEILILDKLPREEAKNVWRFGLGGLGFSSNGYEGPFETAITMDGQINANFITVGQMNVARIEGLTDSLNEIYTAIELNATNIQLVVNKQNDNEVKIAQIVTDIDEISSTISSVETKVETIEENVSETQTALSNRYTKIETDSKIEQKTQSIISTVSQTYSTKVETEELKEEVINSANLSIDNKLEGYSKISTVQSMIKQTAKSIALSVSNNSTTAGINITLKDANGEVLDSKSGTINLTGFVKFTDLSGTGSTTINGSNITTGTISSDRIDTSNLKIGSANGGTEIGASAIGWLKGVTASPSKRSWNIMAYFGVFDKTQMHIPRKSVGMEIWDNGEMYVRNIYTESRSKCG